MTELLGLRTSMSLVRLNTNPSRRDLRVFSALWFAFFAAWGAVAWKKGAHRAAVTLWVVAALGGAAGLAAPIAMRWVYLASVYLTFPLGVVSSYVILGVVYYLVLTPIGLIMRTLGHDSLARRFEPDRKTYWRPRSETKPASTYFRQH